MIDVEKIQYKIIPENEPDGEGNCWFECKPQEAEAWSIWTLEGEELCERIEMVSTKEQAESYLQFILSKSL